MSPTVPTPFAEPVVAPNTTTLFRRTPYISPNEYKQAPTAVATNNLVPGGGEDDQVSELASTILRASGWVDDICFHQAPGTLAAMLSTESAWVRPKGNGELLLFCNLAGPNCPILQVNGVALGRNPQELQSIGSSEAQAITIDGQTIRIPSCELPEGSTFGASPTASNGSTYAVWNYVSGFPHTTLAEPVEAGANSIAVASAEPGAEAIYGVYEGTQLTIHDGASTEVVVVSSVDGLTLNLASALQYAHSVPPAPNSIRVSAIPWVVEQACISLTSALIKKRGGRAMVMPSAPGGMTKGGGAQRQESQPGGTSDEKTAMRLLKAYTLPVLRSA